MKRILHFFAALTIAVCAVVPARADDLATRCMDRAAIERVYHEHRTGTKQPFEQAMSRETIEKLVRQDQRKEAVLKKVYGVEITPDMVAAEVRRIDTTTRAPEVLQEIKHALGDDPGRFARAMARPIVAERELRQRFDHDDTLHAATRREAEQARQRLIEKKPVPDLRDVTWQLTPRPTEGKSAPGSQRPDPTAPPPPTKSVATSGLYTVEATAQLSQVVASPDPVVPGREKVYFEDLQIDLQRVLQAQLKKPGDVSAVIETPGGFLVFLAKDRNPESLSAASFSIPKRSYDEWLSQQPADQPGGGSAGER